jgi:hypothetical protein
MTDIWIIALPINTLLKINRPQKERIALMCVFGIGTFATIMSIIRLHTIYTYTLAKDPFQESILVRNSAFPSLSLGPPPMTQANRSQVNVWSIIEINAGILCASAPALKPLFTPAALMASRQTGNGSSKRNGYEYHSQGRSGYIKSSKSVDQTTSSQHSVAMGPIPFNTTKITGGEKARTKDSDSTQDILRE